MEYAICIIDLRGTDAFDSRQNFRQNFTKQNDAVGPMLKEHLEKSKQGSGQEEAQRVTNFSHGDKYLKRT